MTLSAAVSLFGPYFVALFALLGTIYSIRSQHGKFNAEASEKIAAASAATIDALNEHIAQLSLKSSSQALQIQELRQSSRRTMDLVARLVCGIQILVDQLHETGVSPRWSPDPEIEKMIQACVDTGTIDVPKAG